MEVSPSNSLHNQEALLLQVLAQHCANLIHLASGQHKVWAKVTCLCLQSTTYTLPKYAFVLHMAQLCLLHHWMKILLEFNVAWRMTIQFYSNCRRFKCCSALKSILFKHLFSVWEDMMRDLNNTDHLSELNQEGGCQRSLFPSVECCLAVKAKTFMEPDPYLLQPHMLNRQQFVGFAISLYTSKFC